MARRADIGAIASLSRREIEQGLPHSWTPERLQKFFALATTNVYVAQVGKQLVGFSVANIGDVRAHLVLLAVERKYRQLGIGRELLAWQLLAAQTAGIASMSLEVRSSNNSAQRFYASLGFKQVRILPNYYCGQEDAVRLRLHSIRTSQTILERNSP